MRFLGKNELFLVVDQQPEAFLSSMRGCLYYMLTFILLGKEDSILILTPPGMCFSLDSLEIDQMISIYFSDFFIELCRKNVFSLLDTLLQRAGSGLLFSNDVASYFKEQFIRLKSESGFESVIQLLYTMKALAESKHVAPLLKGSDFKTVEAWRVTDRISKVRKYVTENFRKPVKIEEIALEIGLSPNSFSRFFKKVTGLNFSDYVNGVRIEEAIRLLEETNDTIAGIAYSCGFNSSYYFSDVFKHNKGMTPGKFREHAGKGHRVGL